MLCRVRHATFAICVFAFFVPTTKIKMSIEITLIQEIEKHPCLYNFFMHEYNKKEILDEAWAAVAASCNLTVPECKDKWKNIRSSFVRSLKQNGGRAKKPYYLSHYLQFVTPFLKSAVELSTDSESQQFDNNSVDLADDLPILAAIKLEPDVELETSSVDFNGGASNMDTEPPRAAVSSHPRSVLIRRRRKAAALSRNNSLPKFKTRRMEESFFPSMRGENSAMKFFLMSLLPEFDSMTEDQIRIFKIKVMMLINDIKTKEIEIKDTPKKDSERLQKRLINLLLRNLEKNTE